MANIVQRFENFRRNGLYGWAHAQPAPMEALLFLPRLVEYLLFKLLCLTGFAAVVILMASIAIFRLDREADGRL
jgi:hypothetical protein